ncbi:hypothetical protein HNQ69_001583 [Bartonella callosciuri]|uniref:Uncharacterized protein n=1 Tax=Bartonella callosciuri TaxID=686223 RepID=A0A840NTQ2_9HYPH|nr:hypothetical protein [Bartonella callosciuri]
MVSFFNSCDLHVAVSCEVQANGFFMILHQKDCNEEMHLR